MKNFVISLADNNVKRRTHIEQEFSKSNVDFVFFNAITPDMNKSMMSKYNLEKIPTSLTDKEISCFLSHFALWKKVIEDNLDFAVIFEDDIFLGENCEKFLTSNNWIDSNVDLIKIEKGWQKTVKTSLFNNQIYDREICELKSAHYGGAGYIISNKGAKNLIDYCGSIKKLIPVDIIMFDELLNKKKYQIYQMLPAICVQDFILNDGYLNFNSELEEERAKNYINMPIQQKVKKSILFKIKRESIKPFIQIYNFCYKKLYIKNVTYK